MSTGTNVTAVVMTTNIITIKSGGRQFVGPLALVVGEHIDKLPLFEPGLRVLDKEVTPDEVRFTLETNRAERNVRFPGGKPLEEIVRGYKIGCFKIAREYKLISKEDEAPLFAEGCEIKEVTQ